MILPPFKYFSIEAYYRVSVSRLECYPFFLFYYIQDMSYVRKQMSKTDVSELIFLYNYI